VEAERAGFDGVSCSDHLQPWWEPGQAGQAWVWLGGAGQATQKVALGTAVTPPGPRYHPVLIAQAWATLERMFPGRTFLGVGSGESLNESPLAAIWPPVSEQVERMEEGLEIIRRLFDGERLSYDGSYFETDEAILHTRPNRRPPIYVSAFGPRAAGIAARWADGVLTLASAKWAPKVIEAYRGACEDVGKEPGEIVLQISFSWAEDDDAALEGARVWKGSLPTEFYTDDWHDPRKMYEEGERQVSDDDLKDALIISSDPEVHVERIREVERLGATTIALMNVSGADPHKAIEVYGSKVLPALAKAPAR
jgi:coenzyme F420-dependent glucose-6-phosphate dehydrogenase